MIGAKQPIIVTKTVCVPKEDKANPGLIAPHTTAHNRRSVAHFKSRENSRSAALFDLAVLSWGIIK
jgi:hypothetical protein